MATMINTAMSTSTALPEIPVLQRNKSKQKDIPASVQKKITLKKYNHVFAIHHQSKASPLSQDSTETLSFFGFKNLMALMLSKSCPDFEGCSSNSLSVISNLRLMIENFRKV
jgi:diacylglycerol O-acyltransferase-1